MKKLRLLFVLFLLLSAPARAVEPDEMLPDPALEARARAITKELRCLVCQGQDIDDSAAPLAADLRKIVRAQLKLGASDADVLGFVRARYGDYVLLRPPVEDRTLALWLTPFAVLVLGFAAAAVFLWRNRREGGA